MDKERGQSWMMNIYHIYQLWDLLIEFMYALDVSREPKLDGGERKGVGQRGYMRAKTAISATAATSRSELLPAMLLPSL